MKPVFPSQSAITDRVEPLRAASSQVREVFERLSRLKEDRAIVLVGALFVENAINEYLASIIPDFPSVDDKTDMTFSTKIELAKALKMAPSHIFNSAHRIREIRNNFAHEINIENFKDLDPSYFDSLRAHLENYGVRRDLFEGFDFYGLFRDLTQNTVLNLNIHTWHNLLLNNYIRTDEFLGVLQKKYEEENPPQVYKITGRPT